MNSRRVKQLDELARDIPPARDLWPAIAATIEADKAAAAAPPQSRRRPVWMPAAGMAAAVALVAVGVLIGHMFPSQPGLPPVTQAQSAGNVGVIPAAFRKQRDQLLVEAEAKLSTMAPAERDKVKASLATLSRSITEIEAALGHDPANALLQELLVSSCQEQMRALTAVRDSGRQEI